MLGPNRPLPTGSDLRSGSFETTSSDHREPSDELPYATSEQSVTAAMLATRVDTLGLDPDLVREHLTWLVPWTDLGRDTRLVTSSTGCRLGASAEPQGELRICL